MTPSLFLISIACLLATTSIGRSTEVTVPDTAAPYVILKLDDLWCEDNVVHTGWDSVITYLNEQNIKGSIGLVGESLEEDNPSYYEWILQRQAEGHEIWNHGFCHCRNKATGISEYKGKSPEEQLQSIRQTQTLAQEKLNITLRTFGAPYNHTDQSTVEALEDIPSLKVWLYKETDTHTTKYQLPRIREVNIEYPVHQPDFAQFVKGYELHKTEPVLIIQGHPRSWQEDLTRLQEFKRIISFLKKENVRFITPYEYYTLTANNADQQE